MDYNALLCEKLLQIKAIKLNPQNPFTWASGIKSPIYCDNRVTLSYPEARVLVKEGLHDVSLQLGTYDSIAGVATAGIAHGALLADYLDIPFIYVRAEAKSHGRQNKVEGDISQCKKILVVEDLISTGGSTLQVVDILQEMGVEVVGAVAIFDYGFEKAKENFALKNIPYKTISNYENLIAVAKSTAYISAEEAEILSEWSADAAGWYAKNFGGE
jgi:orotate phosphoribosyltransferase